MPNRGSKMVEKVRLTGATLWRLCDDYLSGKSESVRAGSTSLGQLHPFQAPQAAGATKKAAAIQHRCVDSRRPTLRRGFAKSTEKLQRTQQLVFRIQR